jgi:hypothetical protein
VIAHWEHTKYSSNEPLGNTRGTFFGKIQGVPISFLMGHPGHMTWNTVNVLRFSFNEPLRNIGGTFFGKFRMYPWIT